jgi:hypothetical protein
MLSKATIAIARLAAVTSPPTFGQTTRPMPTKPKKRPSQRRDDTAPASRAEALRVNQSAVSTGCSATMSADVPAPRPALTAAQTPPR